MNSATTVGGFDRSDAIARLSSDQEPIEHVSPCSSVFRLGTPFRNKSSGVLSKSLALMSWQVRVFATLMKLKPLQISPHSVEVLPVCAAAAILLRATLIYETHELENQKSGSGPLYRRLAGAAERLFIWKAALIVTVSDSITLEYRNRFPKKLVHTARNFPLKEQGLEHEPYSLREKFDIPPERRLLIYQGAIGVGRGVECILDAFLKHEDLDYDVVFMGYGELVDKVIASSKKDSRIHFTDPVHPMEVLGMTKQADVALCLIEGVSLSYEYSLPNKLLEATMAGVPTVVSDFTEMRNFVLSAGCGWVSDVDGDKFAKLLREISQKELQTKRQCALEFAKKMNWEAEVQAVTDLQQKLTQTENRSER